MSVSATPLSSVEVRVAWEASWDSPTRFRIGISTDQIVWTESEVSAGHWNKLFGALSPNTLYAFRVCAIGAGGTSDWVYATARTLSRPNAAPVSQDATITVELDGTRAVSGQLAATDADGDGLTYRIPTLPTKGTLSWTASSGTFTYTAKTTTTVSHTDRFTFAVRDGALSSNTATVSVQFRVSAPLAPGPLTAVAQAVTQAVAPIDLTWSDNSANETSFVVEVSLDNVNFAVASTLPAGATALTYPGSPGATYFFRVKALSSFSESAYSNVVSSTGRVETFLSPTDLRATVVSPTQINLSWNDNAASETGYRVYYSTNQSQWTAVALAANTSTLSLTALVSERTYYFKVVALQGATESAPSNVATATTPILVVSSPLAKVYLNTATELYSLNMETTQVHYVGDFRDEHTGVRVIPMVDIAMSPDGRMYGLGLSTEPHGCEDTYGAYLFRINPNTAQTTYLGCHPLDPTLDYYPSGQGAYSIGAFPQTFLLNFWTAMAGRPAWIKGLYAIKPGYVLLAGRGIYELNLNDFNNVKTYILPTSEQTSAAVGDLTLVLNGYEWVYTVHHVLPMDNGQTYSVRPERDALVYRGAPVFPSNTSNFQNSSDNFGNFSIGGIANAQGFRANHYTGMFYYCASDAGRLYSVTADKRLVMLNLNTSAEAWSMSLPPAHSPNAGWEGATTNPMPGFNYGGPGCGNAGY